MLYFYERINPKMMNEKTNDLREIRIRNPYSSDGFPKIISDIPAGNCVFFKDEDALFKGDLDNLDASYIYIRLGAHIQMMDVEWSVLLMIYL